MRGRPASPRCWEGRSVSGLQFPAQADVAQLVEHITRNDGVRGSNPRVGFSSSSYASACSDRRESQRTMLRRRRLLLFSLIALAALVPAGTASARTVPAAAPFRVVIVDHMAGWQLRLLARHGAVGLLVPGAGPTTNRRQALAQLVRGRQETAHLRRE